MATEACAAKVSTRLIVLWANRLPAFGVRDHQGAGRVAADPQRHKDGGADVTEPDDRLVSTDV